MTWEPCWHASPAGCRRQLPSLNRPCEANRISSDDPLPIQARRMSNRIGEAFEAWQKYVEKMPALRERNIKFIFDEWGCRYCNSQGAPSQAPGMLTPLSYGLFLNDLYRHSDMVAASCPTGGLGTVLIDNTGEAVGFSAEGLVMKIMATHFADALPVPVSGNSPQQSVDGTPFVDKPSVPVWKPHLSPGCGCSSFRRSQETHSFRG